ncbi:hypothetical protein CC80DRAFT_551478 [Byssothecium circinans]|uniref:PQ-loop-domain-containing protein n=1 Tax=Byssothecium circinans TaxID=147558 RepID=A0A6A5TL40_9PLEO|nr:hypothetical protein CC80DRAFT_551478 [Byssothecium circinans]
MTRPQETIPPAADVLGTIGTNAGVFKIWHNWRRKSTDGLPGVMLMLWAGCAVPFGVYAIVQNFSIALQLQPQCFGGLTLITWGQTLYYHNKWRAWTATAATLGMACAFAGTEVVLVVTLRRPYYKGVVWPMMMMAIIASAMQCGGLLLPFWELAKRNGRVVGINFMFLTIDYAGAFFSLMALVAQHTFDLLGGSMYIVCMSLETGIFLSQAIWLWRVRHVRREAKKAGKTYDEYVTEHPSKKLARSKSANTLVDVEASHSHAESTEILTHPKESVEKPAISASLEERMSTTENVDENADKKMIEATVSMPEKTAQPAGRE